MILFHLSVTKQKYRIIIYQYPFQKIPTFISRHFLLFPMFLQTLFTLTFLLLPEKRWGGETPPTNPPEQSAKTQLVYIAFQLVACPHIIKSDHTYSPKIQLGVILCYLRLDEKSTHCELCFICHNNLLYSLVHLPFACSN